MKNLLIIIVTFTISISAIAQKASYYHDKYHGRKTASGEVFSQNKYTCASNKYKLGTRLRVTNPKNGKSIIVRVNDTGKLYGRTIDLSKSAFRKIANLKQGVIKVKIQIL